MNLHAIYETLLRRGMPEHANLEWNAVWKRFILDDIFDVGINESDARDLVTMHALQWARDRHAVEFVFSRNAWQLAELVELDKGDVVGARCYAKWFDDPLDAILAATAHLEPK